MLRYLIVPVMCVYSRPIAFVILFNMKFLLHMAAQTGKAYTDTGMNKRIIFNEEEKLMK